MDVIVKGTAKIYCISAGTWRYCTVLVQEADALAWDSEGDI